MTKNPVFAEEFALNVRNYIQDLDARIGKNWQGGSSFSCCLGLCSKLKETTNNIMWVIRLQVLNRPKYV